MRSKELKVYNLPLESKLEHEIDAKPYVGLGIMVLVGLIMITSSSTTVFGIILTILCLCFMVILPKVVLIEFFAEHMIMYNKASKEDCALIYYEDVVSYKYIIGVLKDYLVVNLEDGSQEVSEAYSKLLFERYMNKHCPGKRIK